MPDIAKWTDFVQWIALAVGAVAGALAGIFGTRRGRPVDDDRGDERQRIVEQARLDERQRVQLESQVAEARIKSELRSEFYKTFEKYHNDQEEESGRLRDKIERMVDNTHDLKNTMTGLQAEVEALKARRPR